MNFLKLIFLLMLLMFCEFGFSTEVYANPSFATLESASGGRLGVSAIDTNNHAIIQYRGLERFPMDSTFKFMLVSAILKQSMSDPHLLSQKIMYTKKDIDAAEYAPVTKKHISTGMTISQLCGAAITQSDNGAANLLMKKLGGPEVVTAFARSIGDKQFRLDRWEPDLNSAIPGDFRDTTTPLAMANSLQKIVLGKVLSLSARQQLQMWLKSNTTGDARIRAAVPQNWLVGDKTGTGGYGTTNDIGIIWPPHCQPVVVAIYFAENKKEASPRDDIVAGATRMMLNQLNNAGFMRTIPLS